MQKISVWKRIVIGLIVLVIGSFIFNFLTKTDRIKSTTSDILSTLVSVLL